MPPFTKRALYSAVDRKLQREARGAFRRSPLGQIIEDARKDYRQTATHSGKLESVLDQFARGGVQGAIGQLAGNSLNGLVGDIVRYSRGPNAGLVNAFLKQLGPAGKIIGAIASAVGNQRRRPTTGDRDVDAARELIEAFGYTVSSPSARAQPDVSKSVQAATEFLESHGYQVRPVGGGKLETVPATSTSSGAGGVGTIDPPGRGGGGSGDGTGPGSGSPGSGGSEGQRPDRGSGVEVNIDGVVRRFPKNHPLVTRSAVNTPQSSNVYAFAYDIDTRELKIRFDAMKTKANPTKRPGPIYKYTGVSPKLFLDMMDASSKGGFVWDRIRIRGTVAGHRYNYQLVSVTENYVPRQATLKPDGEYFEKRKVNVTHRGSGKRSYLESKETIKVSGRPNRGEPNRGRPNRGR